MEKKNETVHKDPIPRLSATLKKKQKKQPVLLPFIQPLPRRVFTFFIIFFLPGFTGFYRVFPSIKQPTAFETAKKIKEGGNKKNNTEHFWISFFFWFLLVSGGSQLGARRLARQLAPRRQSATPQVSYLRSVHRTIKKNTKKGQTEKKEKEKKDEKRGPSSKADNHTNEATKRGAATKSKWKYKEEKRT